jgi:catechol 2,3-dioxygenase-like lactoylglutathione lyase family enzyme
MKRLWTIIGVKDVARSVEWYQALLGSSPSHPPHDEFGQIADDDGEVLISLHRWGDHDHPSLAAPEPEPGNGLLLFFRVDDFERALQRAYRLVGELDEAPHRNPNTGTMEFALRDPDGYRVTVSALKP